MELNLIGLNDLWHFAIVLDDFELFEWVLHSGADTNYHMPFAKGFLTPVGACLLHKRMEMFNLLLYAYVDVNASPKQGYENLIILFLSCFEADINRTLVSKLLAETSNTFSYFSSLCDNYYLIIDDHRFLGETVAQELKKRLDNGTIDLAAFDEADFRNWKLIDRVALKYSDFVNQYEPVIHLFRKSGLKANFSVWPG